MRPFRPLTVLPAACLAPGVHSVSARAELCSSSPAGRMDAAAGGPGSATVWPGGDAGGYGLLCASPACLHFQAAGHTMTHAAAHTAGKILRSGNGNQEGLE